MWLSYVTFHDEQNLRILLFLFYPRCCICNLTLVHLCTCPIWLVQWLIIIVKSIGTVLHLSFSPGNAQPYLVLTILCLKIMTLQWTIWVVKWVEWIAALSTLKTTSTFSTTALSCRCLSHRFRPCLKSASVNQLITRIEVFAKRYRHFYCTLFTLIFISGWYFLLCTIFTLFPYHLFCMYISCYFFSCVVTQPHHEWNIICGPQMIDCKPL